MTTFIMIVFFTAGHSMPLSINEFDSMAKCEAVRRELWNDPALLGGGLWQDQKIKPENSVCREIKY